MRVNETTKDITEELVFNDTWLTDEYKQSQYYRDYLREVFNTLEKATHNLVV